MAVDTKRLPVAAIWRVIIVIVISITRSSLSEELSDDIGNDPVMMDKGIVVQYVKSISRGRSQPGFCLKAHIYETNQE
jgi:hypothetical protein